MTRLTQLLAAALCIAGLGLSAALAAPSSPKKVETERITVDPATPAPPPATPSGPAPEIHTGAEGLPAKVAETRRRILDAAYSGDMNRLKSVIQQNELPPIFSVNQIADPVEYLKSQSGDGEGLEILAIMTQVLESGWARVNPGTPQEMFVWPYFASIPVDKLEPAQMVQLYKIVTSADFEEMRTTGKYSFYAFGIGPDGTWHYFKLND